MSGTRQEIEISKLQLPETNPRKITKDNLERLKRDLLNDPAFLEKRPILVNKVNEQLLVYAGNQRVRAAKELGWKMVFCDIEENLPEEVIRKRTLIDNIEYGEWNISILQESWDTELKNLDLPTLEDFVSWPTENKEIDLSSTEEFLFSITLKFPEDRYWKVKKALGENPEQKLWQVLTSPTNGT